MSKRSFRSFAKPNLEAEIRHQCGDDFDHFEEAIASILRRDGDCPPGLRRALASLFAGKDDEYTIHIVRRSTGRPVGTRRTDAAAQPIASFVKEKLDAGVVLKAAIADACSHFRVSRATVYSRIGEARRAEIEAEARKRSVATILENRKPGGGLVGSNKRSVQRLKRRKARKPLRSYRQIRIGKRDLERALRMERLSKKRNDNLD